MVYVIVLVNLIFVAVSFNIYTWNGCERCADGLFKTSMDMVTHIIWTIRMTEAATLGTKASRRTGGTAEFSEITWFAHDCWAVKHEIIKLPTINDLCTLYFISRNYRDYLSFVLLASFRKGIFHRSELDKSKTPSTQY